VVGRGKIKEEGRKKGREYRLDLILGNIEKEKREREKKRKKNASNLINSIMGEGEKGRGRSFGKRKKRPVPSS